MRLALLFPLALLAACAPPAPDAQPADGAFDARAWRRAAAAVDATGDHEAVWARMRALTDRLDAATGWKAACADALDEPAFASDGSGGVFELYPLSDDEALVEVTCRFFAYQGLYALVHLDGSRAALVPGPQPGERGAPADTSAVYLGFFSVEPAARTFRFFAKSRGPGDCGTLAAYALGEDAARLLEVRARDCDAEVPGEDAPPSPDSWPVVYPTR